MTCEECPKRNSCKKTCKAIERELRKAGIYSADYIRPQMSSSKKKDFGNLREIPFSDLQFDIERYDGTNFH